MGFREAKLEYQQRLARVRTDSSDLFWQKVDEHGLFGSFCSGNVKSSDRFHVES